MLLDDGDGGLPLADPDAAGRRQRRRPRLLPRRLRRASCAGGSRGRCSARSTRSSATTSSTTPGTRSSPAASRRPTTSAFVEGFGGERDLAVWQAIVLGLRGLGRLVDDDHYPASAGAGARACSHRSWPSSAIRSPARTTCGQAARPAHRARWRSRAATRRAGALRRAVRAGGGRPGQVDPEPSPPPRRWWPRRATRPCTTGCSSGTATRRPRRTSSATSTRSPSSTPRSSSCARASWR